MLSRKIALSLAALLLPAAAAAGYLYNKRPYAISGVEADTIPLAHNIRDGCEVAEPRDPCYERELLTLSKTRGIRIAMGTLNHLSELESSVQSSGHALAHAIGIDAGRGKSDVTEEFGSCTEILQSGCYHGVIQGYFESVTGIDTASVNALCDDYAAPDASRWLRFQCAHGLGHGLTMFWGHDLPRALGGCDLLLHSWDRESCYGGAFMENIVNATAPHHPGSRLAAARQDDHSGGHQHGPAAAASAPPFKALDSADLQYPCSIVDSRYHPACYGMQTSIMLRFTGGDVARAGEACRQAPGAMPFICALSLGRDVIARVRQNHRRAAAQCALISAEFEPWCHTGVAKNLVDLTARSEDGMAYCLVLEGERNKLKCYEGIGEQIGNLRNRSEQRALLCEAAEPAYRAACFFGARVTDQPPPNLPVARAG